MLDAAYRQKVAGGADQFCGCGTRVGAGHGGWRKVEVAGGTTGVKTTIQRVRLAEAALHDSAKRPKNQVKPAQFGGIRACPPLLTQFDLH